MERVRPIVQQWDDADKPGSCTIKVVLSLFYRLCFTTLYFYQPGLQHIPNIGLRLIMRKSLILIFTISAFWVSLAVSCLSGQLAVKNPSYSEEMIIGLVLSHLWSGAKYTVVSPGTTFCRLNMDDEEELVEAKKYLLKKLVGNDQDLKRLLEQLFTINRIPFKLRQKSNIEKGYFIDYEGEYEGYFEENGGGWDKWYKDHPNADGETEVSRPVYDERNGIIMIYVGTQVHWKAGVGNIIVFKLKNNKLKELSRVMVWIS